MSDLGLNVFDKTVQSTHVWLNEIGDTIGPDTQHQYHALRAVLFALRDRLTLEEAFHFSAQVPMLVRGILWEGYRPAGKPETYRTREDFLDRVSGWLDVAPALDPEQCARAVFATITRQIQPGEVEEIRQMLPEPIRTLFPET